MFKPDTPLIQLSDDTTQTRPNYCDVVEIDDFPPTTVERLLEYIYTGCIKLPSDLDDIGSLLAAGDKYELEELKNQCLHAACIQMNFENVGEIAILAYRHNADLSIQREIRQFCQRYVFGTWTFEYYHIVRKNSKCHNNRTRVFLAIGMIYSSQSRSRNV